jgi:anti-anti-sigma factor
MAEFTAGSGSASCIVTMVDEEARTVLAVAGELDSYTAESLRRALDALPDSGPVAIDLSRVSFMDTNGLGVLMVAHARLGDRLVVRNPSTTVSSLFWITRARDVLDVSDE